MRPKHLRRWRSLAIATIVVIVTGGLTVWSIVTDMTLVGTLHGHAAEHIDQQELLDLVEDGLPGDAFHEAFEHGDELFESSFTALDGVGANVGQGQRFTRVPRADLAGPGEWATHIPARATGPNAISCNACHIQLFDDGSGSAVANVHRDPLHSGNLKQFIQRNTPHLFAPGALQRLAEEMTTRLHSIRTEVRATACANGFAAPTALVAKGVGFGAIAAKRVQGSPCRVEFDTSKVQGVSDDLVVRPFQWKGSFASLRSFNRNASHNELGMQAVKATGDGIDGDYDGVADELTIGDMTALTVYLAAQPRPTSTVELAEKGIIAPLESAEADQIRRGRGVLDQLGCSECHVPALRLNDPIFSEPSQLAEYRDIKFPAGQDPVSRGVTPALPVSFDLTNDQPDNQIKDENGNVVHRLGSLRKDNQGRAVVELFGDLKRHFMGRRLAESIDEEGTGAGTFLTENLWGVGSTAPYLHDGRATTLTEAILEHGGEAAASRDKFRAAAYENQQAVVAFLNNLVLFKIDEDDAVVVPPPAPSRITGFNLKVK
jgi:hypothetical protein